MRRRRELVECLAQRPVEPRLQRVAELRFAQRVEPRLAGEAPACSQSSRVSQQAVVATGPAGRARASSRAGSARVRATAAGRRVHGSASRPSSRTASTQRLRGQRADRAGRPACCPARSCRSGVSRRADQRARVRIPAHDVAFDEACREVAFAVALRPAARRAAPANPWRRSAIRWRPATARRTARCRRTGAPCARSPAGSGADRPDAGARCGPGTHAAAGRRAGARAHRRGGRASQRRRRRHCFAACVDRGQAPRRGCGVAAPTRRAVSRNAASACQRAASRHRRGPRSGSRASTSAARSQASARSTSPRADSSIAASRGCVPSASMRRPKRGDARVGVERAEPLQQVARGGERARGGASTKRRSSLPQAASSSAQRGQFDLRDLRRALRLQPLRLRPQAISTSLRRRDRRDRRAGRRRPARSPPSPVARSRCSDRSAARARGRLSITTRTPGRVTLDSATLVASTTRRRPSRIGLQRARSAARRDSSPCSGSDDRRRRSASADARRCADRRSRAARAGTPARRPDASASACSTAAPELELAALRRGAPGSARPSPG